MASGGRWKRNPPNYLTDANARDGAIEALGGMGYRVNLCRFPKEAGADHLWAAEIFGPWGDSKGELFSGHGNTPGEAFMEAAIKAICPEILEVEG